MSSLFVTSLKGKIKTISILDAIKIAFIIFVSISLLINIIPFFDGRDQIDDYDIAIAGINLAKGSYGYTNELWQETGSARFTPPHWFGTEKGVVIPISSPAIVATSAFSYLIGGYYGLFYLGPIFSILFLIISERVATKLFGSFVGLIALILLGTDLTFFNIGLQLLTDNIFAVFFILGVFYLIKFLRLKKDKLILVSSIFFVTAAFFRFNGLIFLPIEVSLVVGYFIFQNISSSRQTVTSNNKLSKIIFSKINHKKILKISALTILPWLTILSFWLIYNDYYFGDPSTTYYTFWGYSSEYLLNSFFIFDFERFDSIISYFVILLPDLLGTTLHDNSLEDKSSYSLHTMHFQIKSILKNSLSIFSLLVLVSALLVALFRKSKRTEIIVFIIFVLGLVLFYSSAYSVSIAQQDRFMNAVLPLSFMLFGFILDSILKINLGRFSIKSPNIISKSFKVGFLILVGIFLFLSLIDSEPVQKILKDDFQFKNPEVYASRYPLDPEGLLAEKIIVGSTGVRALDYNAIPFIPTRSAEVNQIGGNLSALPQKPIQILKKVINEGSDAITFKDQGKFDPLYFRYLESEHGIILKDYSKTFCKMILIENLPEKSGRDIKSDDICYMYRGKVVPKN